MNPPVSSFLHLPHGFLRPLQHSSLEPRSHAFLSMFLVLAHSTSRVSVPLDAFFLSSRFAKVNSFFMVLNFDKS